MKNKEITIYELLGLIKDGKAPKKIKSYKYGVCKFCKFNKDYRMSNGLFIFDVMENIVDLLDDYIEILDEETDEFEDIEEIRHDMYSLTDNENRINKLIRNQKKIIEKLEEK